MAERYNVWKPETSRFYYCRFTVGGQIFRGSTKRTTRAEATDFVKEWKRSEMRKHDETRLSSNANLTFLPAVDRYVREFRGSEETKRNMEAKLDWLVDEVGPTTRLVDIDNDLVAKLCARRGDMDRFGRKKNGKIKPSTVSTEVVALLSAILRRAKVAWNVLLPRMPEFGLHKTRPDPRKRELSLHEEFAIHRAAGDFGDILDFAMLSGLRRAELIIKWSQVYWELGRIKVNAKGDEVHEVLITPGIRRILEANLGRDETYVFTVRKDGRAWGKDLPERPAGAGRPIEYVMLYCCFRHIRRLAGVTDVTIHDYRRTAGARKYRSVGDLGLVQTFLGHKDISMTRRHYVHIKLDDVSKRIIAAEAMELEAKEEIRRRLAA